MFQELNIIIIAITTLMMMYFAIKDNKSYNTDNHQDYKSLIVSTGVLGTFIGIFIGLQGFDTNSIKESVPILLEGLKTAFVTSIEGMLISILLSAIQKKSGKGQAEDEIGILNLINTKLSKLDTLDLLNIKLENISSNTKQLEVLPLVNTKLDSIDTNIKTLSADISSVKEEMRSNQKILFDFLEESLQNVNRTLEEAIDVLAKGATEEIIKALENVIQDFNKNLTEQFGDNFKQLNESVKNMIDWQDNYKQSIINFEEKLTLTLNGYNESINKVKEDFITTLNSSVEINDKSNKKTQEAIEVNFNQAKDSFNEVKKISDTLEKMTSSYEKIASTHEKLEDVISTNKNQINNLEQHLNSLKDIGEKAKLSISTIDEFSEKIQTSLSGQSEALTKLTQDINKQLPDSLDELNKALTSLTNKFRKDYEYFLEQVSKLMASNNK